MLVQRNKNYDGSHRLINSELERFTVSAGLSIFAEKHTFQCNTTRHHVIRKGQYVAVRCFFDHRFAEAWLDFSSRRIGPDVNSRNRNESVFVFMDEIPKASFLRQALEICRRKKVDAKNAQMKQLPRQLNSKRSHASVYCGRTRLCWVLTKRMKEFHTLLMNFHWFNGVSQVSTSRFPTL